MENWKLGPRLAAVASFVPAGARVADVGTDHGLLPLWLLREGRVKAAVASDIKAGPLEAARLNALRCGETRLVLRLCDGLCGLSQEEADTVVIAGMSGETIAAILSASGWDFAGKTLVLQPMSKRHFLVEWLYQSGYSLSGERFAEERGTVYRVLCAQWGAAPLPRPAFVFAGFTDGPYARRQTARLRRAIAGLQQSAAPDEAMLASYRALLEDMNDAYHW